MIKEITSVCQHQTEMSQNLASENVIPEFVTKNHTASTFIF